MDNKRPIVIKNPNHNNRQSLIWFACKSYFFHRVGRDGTLCVPSVFIFVTEKEHNFKKMTISHYFILRKRKKPSLSELTQVYSLWSILYIVLILLSKYKMHRCHAYCSLLRSRCFVSSHNARHIP